MAGSVAGLFMERKSRVPVFFTFSSFPQAMRRQTGKAWVAPGSPPASSTWSSWASRTFAASLVLSGQKRNRPVDRRFWQSQNPLESYDEYFYGRPSAISKNEQTTGKSICLERLLADAGQTVDSVPEIDRLHRHQDAHLRNDLNHDAAFQKLSLRTARSGPPRP
jgi:hypothetical protein